MSLQQMICPGHDENIEKYIVNLRSLLVTNSVC